MKVEHSRSNPAQSGEASGAKQAGRAAAAKEAKKSEKSASSETEKSNSSTGARAEISPKGKEFAATKALATSAPDVREDKVAELKKKIADGSYKVDTQSIADKMVDDHLRMSGIG